jgi:hypothetical protein
MPLKYTKAFEQNKQRFNEITGNIKKIFENIDKPFLNKKPKPRILASKTIREPARGSLL